MQNALATLEAVTQWLDDNKHYIWTLYSSDRKTIISTNDVENDPVKSKAWLTRELTNRSQYGGSFWLYINEKKGNGGNWSPIMLPPLSMTMGMNGGMAGINGGMGMMPFNGGGGGVSGYHGIGDIKTYLDEQRKMWELEKKVSDLETAQQVKGNNFLERQAEYLMSHPDLDPNVVVMAIGGVFSKAVNILEIAFGVNGAAQGTTTPIAPIHNYTPRPKQPVNGTPPTPEGREEEEAEIDDEFNGELVTEVCEDLEVMFPNHKPEDILFKMKEMLKSDPMAQAFIKKKLDL